jgi:hypothetical protein
VNTSAQPQYLSIEGQNINALKAKKADRDWNKALDA